MFADVIAIALGLGVGLSLGALGGGGSTLAVPILVFVAGLQAQDATSASLFVVGIASAIGAWGHYRNGNVRLGAGLAFGGAGIAGNRIGTLLNRSLDEQILLLAFSGLIFFVALRMYRSIDRTARIPERLSDRQSASAPSASAPSAGAQSVEDGDDNPAGTSSLLVHAEPTSRTRSRIDLSAPALARLAVAATAVGFLTGLFGVGGGFAVVPALTLILGFPTKEAIGTSLIVIAINATIALAMRSGDLGFDWGLVLPFLITVTAGVLIGSRVAHRLDPTSLTRGFALMLGVVGVYTAASTLLA